MLVLFPTTPLEALVKESHAVGWPVSYRGDLFVHDKERIELLGLTRFVWVLCEYGTWLITPDSPHDAVILQCCEEDCGPPDKMRHRVYAYDQGELRPVTWDKAWDLLCKWSTKTYRQFVEALRHRDKSKRNRVSTSFPELDKLAAEIEREQKEGKLS